MEKIDFKRPSETAQNLLEPISFDRLLLEIECNIKVITPHTVRVQFELDLREAVQSARDVFNANLPGLMNVAVSTRKAL